MTNKLEQFLEKQIDNGNIDWESKSKLIRTSGEKINGNTEKIAKNSYYFESNFTIFATFLFFKACLLANKTAEVSIIFESEKVLR